MESLCSKLIYFLLTERNGETHGEQHTYMHTASPAY